MRITTLALSAAMVLGGVGVAGMAQAAPEARPTVRPASPLTAARPQLQMKQHQALRLEGALAHKPGTKADKAKREHGEHGKMACEKGKMAQRGKGHGDKARRGKGKHGKAHAQNGKGKKAGERGQRGHDRGGGKA
ncbi:MAG: hypothetical protein KC933_02250 [Myxococcales bacterium]|nr:hypothetical protein [Myxococcales bacterium]